jgi:hypothetical protein
MSPEASNPHDGGATLDGVWAKLARAEEHLITPADEIKAFITRDPQPFGLSVPQFDSVTGWYVVYAIVDEEPPGRLGVILGDVLHNTRSALDHLVWQLVILNGGTPNGGAGGNAFPIARSEAAWRTAQKRQLAGVAEAHRKIIEKTQPFKVDNPDRSPLAWLQFLSNTDKHQIVHPVAGIVQDDPIGKVSFQVTQGPGKVVREQWQREWFTPDAELLRCKVEPMTPDTKVEMIGDVELRLAFSRVRENLPKLLIALAKSLTEDLHPAFAAS